MLLKERCRNLGKTDTARTLFCRRSFLAKRFKTICLNLEDISLLFNVRALPAAAVKLEINKYCAAKTSTRQEIIGSIVLIVMLILIMYFT